MTVRRLALVNCLLLVVSAGAFAWVVIAAHRYELNRAIDDLLRTRLEAGLTVDEPFDARTVYLEAMTADGVVVARSRNLGNELLPVDAELFKAALGGTPSFTTTSVSGHALREYAAPRSTQGPAAVLISAAVLDDELYPGVPTLLLSVVCCVCIALLLGWSLARWMLAPIDHLAATVRAVSSTDDLGQRVPDDLAARHDAIGGLARDVNAMLGRLATAAQQLSATVEAQRRFLADASHELRTPLTSIRGNVQLLARWLAEQAGPPEAVPVEDILNDISLESERMSRLVDGLLVLALADADQHLSLTPTQLTPVLKAALKAAYWLAEDMDLSAGSLAPAVWVDADANRLQQLVLILLENAIRYTPVGGQVALSAAPRAVDQRDGVVVEVTDSGQGVPTEERSRIFERFYRGATTRQQTQGTGLGLAVAAWITAEHHGTITVRDAQPSGSTFSIWLPTVPTPLAASAWGAGAAGRTAGEGGRQGRQ
jgi:signal transduction histidine kinase